MPYDWTEFENFIKNHPNYNLFKEKFTQQKSNPDRNYINFTFSQGSIYSSDYRLRVIQDKKRIHWLDIYFQKTGQEKDLPNVICPQLENSHKHNWDFSLGEWDTDNCISRKFIPLDPQKIGDKQWIFNTMILIADNLPVIENNASALLDNNKQKKAESSERKTKKENSQNTHKGKKVQREFEFGMYKINDDLTIPTAGVKENAFNDFCGVKLTVHGGQRMAIPKFASWAVWDAPKSNEEKQNTNLEIGEYFVNRKTETLKILRPNIIFVGENISQELNAGDWTNFHETMDIGNTRLRYAIQGSCFEGAYLTDIIKGYKTPNGNQVQADVANDQELHKNNFYKELQKLANLTQKDSPMIIILLGGKAKEFFIQYYGATFEVCANDIGNKIKRNVLICERYHYSTSVSYVNYKKQFEELKNELKKHGIKFDNKNCD